MPLNLLYTEGPTPGWVIVGIFREERCFRVCAAMLPLHSEIEAEEIGESLEEALTRLAGKIEEMQT